MIPSLPGYGFSGPTPEAAWTTDRVARAWAELMRRLGYDRYGAHGGDWGAFVAPAVGRAAADHVVGVHVNAATMGFIPLGEVARLADSPAGQLAWIVEKFAAQPGPTPTGAAVFGEDVAIRRYADRGNTVVHWSDFDEGGHFAATETPDLLVGDVRAFFRTVR